MTYNWFGVEKQVVITDNKVTLNSEGAAPVRICEVEERANGQFSAIAKGNWFTEDDKEQAILGAIKYLEWDRNNMIERQQKSTALAEKRKEARKKAREDELAMGVTD